MPRNSLLLARAFLACVLTMLALAGWTAWQGNAGVLLNVFALFAIGILPGALSDFNAASGIVTYGLLAASVAAILDVQRRTRTDALLRTSTSEAIATASAGLALLAFAASIAMPFGAMVVHPKPWPFLIAFFGLMGTSAVLLARVSQFFDACAKD